MQKVSDPLDLATDKIITSRNVKFLDKYDCVQHEIEESSDVNCKKNQSETEVTLQNIIKEEP